MQRFLPYRKFGKGEIITGTGMVLRVHTDSSKTVSSNSLQHEMRCERGRG